jgi:hypothetical protein
MDRMQEEKFYLQRFNNDSPAKPWVGSQERTSVSIRQRQKKQAQDLFRSAEVEAESQRQQLELADLAAKNSPTTNSNCRLHNLINPSAASAAKKRR